MSAPWVVRLVTMLLAGAAGEVAHADIYSFVDAAGVTHFSNVPVDGRYRLLLATPAEERAERPGNWLAKSALYDPMIARAARSAAVRPELVRAVIVVESAFNPRAVSKRGAVGLMQLRPATARRYGVSDAFDPEQNITAGAHYLRDLMARQPGCEAYSVVAAAMTSNWRWRRITRVRRRSSATGAAFRPSPKPVIMYPPSWPSTISSSPNSAAADLP